MELTLTDEQAAEVRTTLGLEADAEITADNLLEATQARANELADAKTKLEEAETRRNEASDATKKLADVERRLEATEKRAFEMERDTDLTAAVRQGKIDPADLDDWKKDYEDNQAGTRRILERLKPDPDLQREFGRDDGEEDETLDDDQYRRDFERRHGMKAQV